MFFKLIFFRIFIHSNRKEEIEKKSLPKVEEGIYVGKLRENRGWELEEVGMILDRKVRKSGRKEEGMENKMKQRMLICSSDIERDNLSKDVNS